MPVRGPGGKRSIGNLKRKKVFALETGDDFRSFSRRLLAVG
jgi:hypothetical protein